MNRIAVFGSGVTAGGLLIEGTHHVGTPVLAVLMFAAIAVALITLFNIADWPKR